MRCERKLVPLSDNNDSGTPKQGYCTHVRYYDFAVRGLAVAPSASARGFIAAE